MYKLNPFIFYSKKNDVLVIMKIKFIHEWFTEIIYFG